MSQKPEIRLLEPCELEVPRIKGSRFIAAAVPVRSKEEAEHQLEQLRARFPDAGHCCYAWRLLGDQVRCSDDGEPSGSAGRPILAVLEGRMMRETLVAVIRYFGGTKLGVGGLVRAYGGAAGAVLDAAEVAVHVPTMRLELRFSYSDQGLVEGALRASGLSLTELRYGEEVSASLLVPSADCSAIQTLLRDCSAGRVDCAPSPGADPSS